MFPPVHQDSNCWRVLSSSEARGEEEAEMSGEDMVWMVRVVTNDREESGEFRCKSSSIYLSISSKNSSISNWYIAMTKDPLVSRYMYFSDEMG